MTGHPPATVGSAEAILAFWLQEIGPQGWYAGGEEIDARCRAAGGEAWQQAAEGWLGLWLTDPRGTLAYLIVTDQLSRNIHRGKAEAFALDAQARAAARAAIVRNWDLTIDGPERQFFYLPFEHSEAMADQNWSVDLFAARLAQSPDNLLHARAHREVIGRFGRFPFRNAALGRTSTAEETAFLQAGGYAALVRELGA